MIMKHVSDSVKQLVKEFEFVKAIETGTIRTYIEKHESTKHISNALKSKGSLISIDIEPKHINVSKDICKNCNNITWVESNSITFLSNLDDGEKFHFALLDSVNDRNHIFKEFKLVTPHMHNGGIIIIDDCGIKTNKKEVEKTKPLQDKGIKVWKFLKKNNIPYEILQIPKSFRTQLKVHVTSKLKEIL